MRRLATYLLALLAIWPGCASVPESSKLPVMGLHEEEEETAPADSVSAVVPSVEPDSVDALAQTLLFMPFKDASKYKGPWDIHAELPQGLADTLKHSSFLRTLPVDSARVRLEKKELQGKVALDRGLEIASELGADYVIFGDIEELSMKRFRATVPVGGYRSYEGLTSVTLRLVKVIDQQPAGQLTRDGLEETKKYGITNPAAFVPFEKEYFLLGQVEWGSEEFHQTLLGKSVGKCLNGLAAALDSLISPPPELTVSEPKIIDVVDVTQAYINIGLVDSVQNGDKFGVWDKGRVLTDPQTGIVLGKALPRRVGVVQVAQVMSERLSLVKILEGGDTIRQGYDIRAE